MYTLIITLITAALIALTVFAEKKPNCARMLMYINLILALLGAVMTVASHALATTEIDRFLTDVEFHSWISDFYDLYYLIALPAFILLFLTNTVAALVGLYDKKQKRIAKLLRPAVSVASSVLLMILPYYGLITENSRIRIYVYIMLSGIGQALIIRLADMLGLLGKIRKS